MAEFVHDALCDEYVGDWRGPRPCYCDLIAQTRTDERIKMSRAGWMAPEAHEAVVAVAKVRAVRHVLAELRREVDELEDSFDGWERPVVPVNDVHYLINRLNLPPVFPAAAAKKELSDDL